MRNGTKANHTQALTNFKAAVQAYNRAQMSAVRAVNEALVNPTAQKVNRVERALKTVTRLEGLFKEAAEATKVPIGKNNFTVTKKNGKIVKLEGRGGEYHQVGAQNGKNYVLKNGAWYQMGNISGQKYNKNKSGKFVKKQGFFGRVGGAVRGVGDAVAGGARATRGALGGLFPPRSRPVKPNSDTERLIESTK